MPVPVIKIITHVIKLHIPRTDLSITPYYRLRSPTINPPYYWNLEEYQKCLKKNLDFVLHQKWPEYGPILLGLSFAV